MRSGDRRFDFLLLIDAFLKVLQNSSNGNLDMSFLTFLKDSVELVVIYIFFLISYCRLLLLSCFISWFYLMVWY